MDLSNIDATLVIAAWAVQCAGLGLFFFVVAAKLLAKPADAPATR